MLRDNLQNILPFLLVFDGFLHKLFFFLLYFLPIEQAASFFNILLCQNYVFQILVGTLVSVS